MKNGRREFVKNSGKLIGTSVFLSSLPWLKVLVAESGRNQVTANEKDSIGVIGSGSRGRLLMAHLNRIPEAYLMAVCDIYDPNINKALAIAKDKPLVYKDYHKLLENKDIDALIIASPLHLHPPMTIDALHAGKDVLCEKAMGRHMEDAFNMIRVQKQTGRILQIGHQRLYNIRFLKGIGDIKEGKYGDFSLMEAIWHWNWDWRRPVPESEPELEKLINWKLYREYSCGLMTELAVHHIQVANWITGHYPLSA